MKEWLNPEIKELGVGSTEQGIEITPHVDDTYIDDNNHKYYSFS